MVGVEDQQEGEDQTFIVKYADGSRFGGVPRSDLRPRTSKKSAAAARKKKKLKAPRLSSPN